MLILFVHAKITSQQTFSQQNQSQRRLDHAYRIVQSTTESLSSAVDNYTIATSSSNRAMGRSWGRAPWELNWRCAM